MNQIGDYDYSQRPDGRWNVWKWIYFMAEDTLPRWVLVGVVRELKT